MKRFATYIILLFSLTGLWTGCTSSEEEVWQPGKDKEKEIAAVRFNLDFSEQATRAMTPTDEERIETIDILAFLQDGSDYRYSYRRQGKDYANGNFTVDLISYNERQILLVLVNARDQLGATTILTTDKVEDVITKITFDSAFEWPANNNGGGVGDFRAIPMTGISIETVVTEGMTEFPTTISLVRMLARINITMAEGLTNFELKNARIFNRVTKGYVGYKPDNWNDNKAWLPVDQNGKPYKTYSPSYAYQAEGEGNASHITNTIYTLESNGVTQKDSLESTAIVVGGIYTPESGAPISCYYRIDLTPNGLLSASAAIDIVRTHSYNVEIQKVSYPGAPTPEEAYEGIVSLSATVLDWKTNTGNTIFDGQYYLKLSQPTISLGIEGNTVIIQAETNYNAIPNTGYPAGVVIDAGSLGSWASTSITQTSASGGIYKYDITVAVSDIPNGFASDSRWSAFFIKAGNMKHQMAVWQWNKIWLTSNVQPNYPQGTDRYEIKLTTEQWQKWKLETVSDPDEILVNAESLIGSTGGGRTERDESSVYFYIKPNASSGKTATLTFINTTADNPSLSIDINTP